MVKKQLIVLLPLLTILMLSIASAYDGYYYPRDDVSKRTVYISDKQSYTNYYPGGQEKVSTTTRTTRTYEDYYPTTYCSYPYSNCYSNYYQYRAYPSSNWRYKEPYNCFDYECSPYYRNYNSYQRPYYYSPRYDSNLGYYNWRY